MRREAKLLHTDGELRARPQQHAAQAGAARNAASRLHAACVPGRSPLLGQGRAQDRQRSRATTAGRFSSRQFCRYSRA